MNVLFDARPIRAPHTGVATYCSEFISHFSNSESIELSPYFQSYKHSNAVAEDFISNLDNIKIYNQSFIPRKLENIFQEFTSLRPFAPHVRSSKFDIVHETYFAKLNSKSKLVSTIHDLIPYQFPHFFNFTNSYFTKRNLRRQVFSSDAIITPSHYTKSQILRLFNVPEEKISVIPLGVSSSVLDTISTQDCYNLTNYFVTVGNIEPRKNHLTAAKAISKLNKFYQFNFKYVVIGRELFNSSSIIEQMTNLLGDNLIITGFLPSSDRNYLLKNSLAHIFSSSYEGFGIPALEAYHLKTLTLLANNSSLTELAVNEWQLFDTFSSDELFLKLKNVVEKNVPSDLVDLQIYFSSNYRWANNISDTIKVYSLLV
jgi:glycosyltransferase involved in cell wall biosynthesis